MSHAHALQAVPTWSPATDRFSPPESHGQMFGAAAVRRVARGASVYDEGGGTRFVYEVVSGVLKECVTLEDGRRQVCGFLRAGDYFGLSDLDNRAHAVEAVTAAIVRCIPRERLFRLVDEAGGGARFVVDQLRRRIAQGEERMALVGRKSASARVAGFLLRLRAESGGADELVLPMSRQDIACFLDLTIETVCRALTQFRKEKLIDMSSARDIRILDHARLVRALEECEA